MKLRMITSICTIFLLITASGIFAQCPKSKSKKGCGSHFMEGIPKLTVEQREKIRKIKLANKKEMIPVQSKLKVMHIELEELIMSGAGKSKLDKKVDEISATRAELMKKQIASNIKIRDILTEEQKKAFRFKMMFHGFGKDQGRDCFGGCPQRR